MSPTPASEHQLCQFVSALASEGLKYSSIKCYLSAVRHLHLEKKLPDPNIGSMARLEQVLRGVKSFQSKQSPPPKPRLPITPDILLKLKKVWNKDPSNTDNIMLWAAVCLGFFGFMRAGEFTVPADNAYDPTAHLNTEDISVDSKANPSMARIKLKKSKTDPFRQGVDIYVGRTFGQLCPVAAILAYLAVRGPGTGPLFMFADGRFLTRDRFVTRVRGALTAAGLDCSQYAGHSLRIGAATTAAQKGIKDSTIKMLGRWQSSAYLLYIRTPRDQLAGVSATLVDSSN